MNLNDLLKNRNAARYMLLAAIAVLGIFANAVLYSVFLKAQGKKNSLLSARRAEYESLWKKYENFAEISAEMKDTAAKARQIADANGIFLNDSGDKGRLSMSEMEKIRDKAGIAIDRFAPGNSTLSVDFRAPFAKTTRFLALLERSFVIDKVLIGGDEKGEKTDHDVSVSVIRIDPAGSSEPVPSELFALYARCKDVIGDIEKTSQVSQAADPVKDPFLARGTILPLLKDLPPPPPPPIRPPDVQIESIVWDKDNPLVIIDSKIYREGDTVPGGVNIIKIHPAMVTVKFKGKDFNLINARKETQ